MTVPIGRVKLNVARSMVPNGDAIKCSPPQLADTAGRCAMSAARS